jgi:hypothetical protein
MYDIIFISYEEPNAEENWINLKERFPTAKRVHGVKGIHQAHITAAKLAFTKMVWIVDGDAQIVDDFNFLYKVDEWSSDCVHVWRSVNPVNGLTYGYGGVKLLPRTLTVNMDINSVDMTTSISSKFKPVQEISNVTVFNTDPFNTWKSAFRECVKLSSSIIHRQNPAETLRRLHTWCTIGADTLYGAYAILGAVEGKAYGNLYKHDPAAIAKINDFQWLNEIFFKTYKNEY